MREARFSMLRIKKISEVVGKHVYTNDGDYFGQIEEVNLVENKIESWRIKMGQGFMSNLGAKGVIVPHQFVKAIGDVVVVNAGAFKGMNKEEGMDVPVNPTNDLV